MSIQFSQIGSHLLMAAALLVCACGSDGADKSDSSVGGGGAAAAGGAAAGATGGAQAGTGGSGFSAGGSGGASAGGTGMGGQAGGVSAGGIGAGGSGGAPSGGTGMGGAGAAGPAGAGGVLVAGGAGDGGTPSRGGDSAAGGLDTNGGSAGDAAIGGSGGSGGASAVGGAAGQPTADWPQINGVQWADTDGDPIQAHGGGLLKVEDYYYWFGENRNPNGTFFAVSAYRSRDLKQWEFSHDVLTMSSDPELDPANIERPKVVYNASTGRYVMWMHWENGSDYGQARAAVASSATVDGDYTYHGSFRPYAGSGVVDHGLPGYMSRDCTLFVDTDGSGYFLSATNENLDLNLYRLTDDYLDVAELSATLFPGAQREAPALFERGGIYFLITSAATGWSPNQAQYATSTSLTSGWSAQRNVADGNTYYSQSTYVIGVSSGAETSYLYLGDRWAGAYGGPVNESSYIWLPITFDADDRMSLSWSNVLDLDATHGQVSASQESFVFVNKNSDLVLDVAGASTANGAGIVQSSPSGAQSQSWSLVYNGRGYFRLSNAMSDRVIDVTDESTQDGVTLTLYDDLDGDNQGWRLIDVGNGQYRLMNQHSGKFMGVVDGSLEPGAAVEQRADSGGDEQIWIAEVAGG